MPPGWEDAADRRQTELDAADALARERRRALHLVRGPTPEELQAQDAEREPLSVPPPTAA